MKISDLITPFPDDFAYRLVDVRTIHRNGIQYEVELVFQRLNKIQNESFTKKDFKKLDSFYVGKLEVKSCSIKYIRLFVIGSVWHNDTKIPEISYLTHYKINESHFLKGDPEKGLIGDFFDDKVPIKFTDSDKTQYFNSQIVLYNLKSPLFHHKKEGGKIPLKNEKPEWETDTLTTFLAFYSYEIYRYFFTCFGASDLNQRLLTSNLTNNLVSENEIYDQSKSGYNEEKKSFLIHLKSNKDAMNTPLIGNIASSNSFRTQMINVANQVSLNNNPFQVFDRLPIGKFRQISFLAKRVKKKNSDDWGLLIFKIEECKGYQEFDYIPIIHVSVKTNPPSNDPGGGNTSLGGTKPGGGGIKPEIKDDSPPNYIGNYNQERHDDWMDLLKPNDDVSVKKPITIKHGTNLGGGKDSSGGDSTSDTPPDKIKIPVNPLDYLSFFPEIIELIKKSFETKTGFILHSSYLTLNDDSLCFENEDNIIDGGDLKFITSNKGRNLYLYVVQLTLQQADPDLSRYFYLLAKRPQNSIRKQGRTWLYSYSDFKGIQHNEKEVQKIIKKYIGKTENSNYDRREPDHKFNHLMSEENMKKGYDTIKHDAAKANHVEKIVNKIIKSLSIDQ